jgi:uncharacterized membrane protein
VSGPEHYAEAERLLKLVRDESQGRDTYQPEWVPVVTLAQVHATLALAAAAALGTSPTEGRAWADVAGTRYSDEGTEPGRRH